MNVCEQAARCKAVSSQLADTTTEVRNQLILSIADALESQKQQIFAANQIDLNMAAEQNLATPIIKRLRFDENKLRDVVAGLRDLAKLPDPLFQEQLKRELDEGLVLVRETCPIGVIGVIFEARPDALVQISALCLKSGNCVILKGGSETKESNRMLFTVIHECVVKAGIDENCMLLLEDRSQIAELLSCRESVDLLIPRGSNAFVKYIMDNTRIPVMGHADGICHIYVDKDADIATAIRVIIDAKTQYVSVCNAVETLLVHKDIVKELMPKLNEAFAQKNVELRASEDIVALTGCKPATEEDDRTEYLDYIISAKTVDCMEDAITHINRYGSHHTDCIITTNEDAARIFMRRVDSAGVYQNCSTRFADGYRYGFGAEVGVSTGKLHARGPVGLEGLVSYKYKLTGHGHIVDDYATGKNQFHFKELI